MCTYACPNDLREVLAINCTCPIRTCILPLFVSSKLKIYTLLDDVHMHVYMMVDGDVGYLKKTHLFFSL